MRSIPDLRITSVCANCQMGAAQIPSYWGDWVVQRNLTKLGDSRGAGWPNVNGPTETHGQNIRRAPVNQVEIEVVLQLRSIEYFKRLLLDFSKGISGCGAKFVGIDVQKRCYRERTWLLGKKSLPAHFIIQQTLSHFVLHLLLVLLLLELVYVDLLHI